MLPATNSAPLPPREKLRACIEEWTRSEVRHLVDEHRQRLEIFCKTILDAFAEGSEGLDGRRQAALQHIPVRASVVRFTSNTSVSPDVLGRTSVDTESSQHDFATGNDSKPSSASRISKASAGSIHSDFSYASADGKESIYTSNRMSRVSDASATSHRMSFYPMLTLNSRISGCDGITSAPLPNNESGTQSTHSGMFGVRRSAANSSLAVRTSAGHLQGLEKRRSGHSISRNSISPRNLASHASQLKSHVANIHHARHGSMASMAEENNSEEGSWDLHGEQDEVQRTISEGVAKSVAAGHRSFSMRESLSSGGGLLSSVKRISSNPFAQREQMRAASRFPAMPKKLVARATKAHNAFERLVNNPIFDAFCALVIVAFMLMLGIETNASAEGKTSNTFKTTTFMFNAWFILELGIRIAAERLNFFWNSPELPLNIMDTVLVFTSVIDLVIGLMSEGSGMDSSLGVSRVARVIRILRAIRAVRLARVMQHVMQFRKMVYLIQGSMGTLFWCLLFLFLVIYMFAVLFTQGVTDHLLFNQGVSDLLNDEGFPEEEDLITVDHLLKRYYGSIPRSISSLFQSMSNGIGWGHVFDPMLEMGWMYSVAFIAFIAFSMFGVLNVLTSVFVESTVQIAMTHRDIIQHDHEKHMEIAVQHLRDVFNAIDHNGEGRMHKSDMTFFLQDPFVHSYLEALDINLNDSATLFKLLDADGSGEVDIDEFCRGCLKLKGAAKSFDLHCLINEISRFLDKWTAFTDYNVSRFNEIEAVLVNMQWTLDHPPMLMEQFGEDRLNSSTNSWPLEHTMSNNSQSDIKRDERTAAVNMQL